jgi:Glyoxalase-like domain
MLDGVSFPWLTVFLDFPAATFDRGVDFWREATGCGLSPFRGPDGEFATLLPTSGDAYLRVQRVRDGAGGCHLDVRVDTAVTSLAEVTDRAVALGARVRHREEGELIVVDSPGGFPFCLVRWEGESGAPGPLIAASGDASRVDTVCLDVPPGRFEDECGFWAALTGWPPRPAPVPGYTYLSQPPGTPMPVHLLLQRLDSAAAGQPVRAHVDVGCTERGETVGRHVVLGSRVVAELAHWTVLADPTGREYCLVDRLSASDGEG